MADSALSWLEFWAPQYTDDSLKEKALVAASAQWGSKALGGLYNQVVGLTAAHILTIRAQAEKNAALAESAGGSGSLTSLKTGGLSASWSGPSSGSGADKSSWLAKTEYGEQVIDLLRKITTTPLVAGENP